MFCSAGPIMAWKKQQDFRSQGMELSSDQLYCWKAVLFTSNCWDCHISKDVWCASLDLPYLLSCGKKYKSIKCWTYMPYTRTKMHPWWSEYKQRCNLDYENVYLFDFLFSFTVTWFSYMHVLYVISLFWLLAFSLFVSFSFTPSSIKHNYMWLDIQFSGI